MPPSDYSDGNTITGLYTCTGYAFAKTAQCMDFLIFWTQPGPAECHYFKVSSRCEPGQYILPVPILVSRIVWNGMGTISGGGHVRTDLWRWYG